jgi:archaellum component FlaC
MSDEPVEDKILRAKLLRDMGLSPWQLKDLFDKMDAIQDQLAKFNRTLDNLHHIMNLRNNALRNDLDDLKHEVESLDEIIDRKY